MSKVLVIRGTVSPKGASFSDAVVDAFLTEYKASNKEDEIIELDLNEVGMAKKSLTREAMGSFFNEEDSLAFIKQLKEVDKVVMSSAMNNFNVTAIIKNYLDHVLLANETFSYKYSKKGDAKGLLEHLTVQIITTQGAPMGWYPFGDHTAYLKGTWEFVGAKVNTPIILAGTKVEPISKLTPIEAAVTIIEDIKKAASQF